MILHIPHSSRAIPSALRNQFTLSGDELELELTRMMDAYNNELFYVPFAKTIVFPISRLIVDVERFSEDSLEPMTKVGMGVIYTKTSDGNKMRRQL